MPNIRETLVRAWADEEISVINRRLDMLDVYLFRSYEPCLPPGEDFDSRLSAWLSNLPAEEDEARKVMFRMAADIFYVGPSEFFELYRLAYNGPIARWLIDQEGIDILAADAQERLKQAVKETWFCPVTDSMRISSFFHVNNIPSRNNLRPEWRSLSYLGDEVKIRQHASDNSFKRLVLLEDFVGGGSQVGRTIEFAKRFAPELRALVVPLIICPAGINRLRGLEDRPHLTVEPVICVPETEFISTTATVGEKSSHAVARQLANSTYDSVSGGRLPSEDEAPYHPLGYPFPAPTGGLIVMFSNTPDNTLPLIHCQSGGWSALFPRHRRV